jgi:hypothetical protein
MANIGDSLLETELTSGVNIVNDYSISTDGKTLVTFDDGVI